MNPRDAPLQPRSHLWAEQPSGATESGSSSGLFSSAARADVDQAIKPRVILFDPLSQSVSVGVGLVNVNYLLPAYWFRLPMADERLRVSVFLRLGGVYNSRRR
jgi:hypothetical protein